MSDFFVSRLGWVNAAVTGNPDGAASVLIDVIDIISSQSISRGIMYEILRWVREVFDWGDRPFHRETVLAPTRIGISSKLAILM